MSGVKSVRYYFDDDGQQGGPVTLQELDALWGEGKIGDMTYVIRSDILHSQPNTAPIPYMMIPRLDVEFSPTVEAFYGARSGEPITVLSGPNNSGKTLLLKQIWSLVGGAGYMLACARFFHVDTLNSRKSDPTEFRRFFENFSRQNDTSQQNAEMNEFQLDRIITSLTNAQRNRLFELAESLIGNKFSLRRTEPDNDLSPFYVDMDGENLRYGSTGTRLLLTLLGVLLNDRFSVILLDEPELGLYPRIQTALARFIYDRDQRQKYCPHLKQVYIATHSHLFLDRGSFANNFIVSKLGRNISATPVQSVSEFHHLQFSMLGNDLESIFLPSAIVLAEGPSDVTFLEKLVRLSMPERKISVVELEGEGNLRDRLRFLDNTFGSLASSPYRTRVFVLLDKKNSQRRERIARLGIPADNLSVLSQNGIEHYYPERLLAAKFHCSERQIKNIDFERDPIEFNGITSTKRDLSKFVCERFLGSDIVPDELSGFIRRIEVVCK